ncbi:MAG: hypothetical protein WCP77_02475 [Roseococcus sp.]
MPLLLLLALPAAAQPAPPAPLIPPFFDRGTVTLRNATALPLRQFFLWNQFIPQEGEDRLQGEALPSGATRDLELGMGHCGVSLRAVFADGSQETVRLLQLCYARELVLETRDPASPPGTEAARVIPR